MNYVLTIPPATEPVSLSEALLHLRVVDTAENNYVLSLITTARQWCEEYTNNAFITQTWTATGRQLCDPIQLLSNVQSVSSVKYLDSDNTQQTLATSEYNVVKSGLIGEIVRAYNGTYPSVYTHPEAVEIVFIRGGAVAPAPVKQAILLLVGHYYENRETTSPLTIKDLPMAANSLLAPYKIPVVR